MRRETHKKARERGCGPAAAAVRGRDGWTHGIRMLAEALITVEKAASSSMRLCVHKIGGSESSCTLTMRRIKSVRGKHGKGVKKCKFHVAGWKNDLVFDIGAHRDKQ